jgi:hypothetical protein
MHFVSLICSKPVGLSLSLSMALQPYGVLPLFQILNPVHSW